MSVVILLIARGERKHLSLHGDDGAALNALIRYVDDHWADAKLPKDAVYQNPDFRISAWFKATDAFYLIADASLMGEPASEVN